MAFGEILRELMEDRDLTQKQLSANINVAAPTLGNYVRGLREPDYETLKTIAAYFGVSVDYLLDYRCGQTTSRLEDSLLRVFRQMTNEQQEMFIEQGKVFVARNAKKQKSSMPTSAKSKAG
jgi:transcriptional regulator with XRE-family HTH domain